MSSSVCSHCGCTEIDTDPARGDAVCTGCGSVLEDQIIVSEVQFQENSGGGSSMVGQFVSSEGPKSISMGSGFQHGMQKESRTITLQNGKKRIQHIAAQMKLNQHCVDTAFNFFKIAVAKRMTRGRKTNHVVAACLYLVCRTERTPHMLLDFSDLLQVNVFVLGRTYLQLSKELCINLPDMDPCLYIPRFANVLEFNDKTHEVSMTAMRLVQRMKRDWMHTGRRPSGLCGAALLVAARIHGFSRSIKEIIKVVKVCQATLKKRLMEFEDTPSSHLTIEEFQKIDLEEEHDPPSFTAGKKKAKMVNEKNKLPELESEISRLQEEIDKKLQSQKPRGVWGAYAKMAEGGSSIGVEGDSELSRISDFLEEETINRVLEESSNDSTATSSKDNLETTKCSESDTTISETSKDSVTQVITSGSDSIRVVISDKASVSKRDVTSDKTSAHVDNQSFKDEMTSKIIHDPSSSLKTTEETTGVSSFGQADIITAVKLGLTEVVQACIQDDESPVQEPNDAELDLTGIDDKELEMLILNEEEIAIKTKWWMEENADYLKQQKEKEERLAKEKEEESKQPEKKKRTYKKKPKAPYQEATTAQEAIQKILHEKKISNKINYDVLNGLNTKFFQRSGETLPFDTPDTSAVVIETKPTLSRFGKPSMSKEIKTEGPPNKKMRIMDVKTENNIPEVVIETGPVQYITEEKEDEAEEEEYFDEDGHVSAAQYFGHTGVEEEDYEYD
ncbi:hypothetical protein CHS0354_032541 [Potamilus streckersoni]|uniref:Transcription factor IIIB 90 kDa subunit n=1 Tax=Potamilus streckersoni TaxID=2493646 RepID=A0AAE0SR27_9BIVA|nr:hypothetical protein CHS0354_032541 [Potamilus streckersoni]